MSLQPSRQRITRLILTLLFTLAVGIGIFASSRYVISITSSKTTSSETTSGEPVKKAPDNWVAYSVDYEMDKARAEKTVEHYGEGVRPFVRKALKNNEENPNRKPTAENSYQRESPLNELLPERIGKTFSQTELLEMQSDTNSSE